MRSQGTKLLLLMAMAIGTVWVPSTVGIQAQESLQDMAKKFPSYVNAIMSVNAQAIKDSKIALANGWTDTYEGKVTSGLIFLPEKAETVLLGVAMDYQSFHPRTTAMLAGVSNAPSADLIRQATQGRIDTMLDVQVVETPNDTYIVRLDDNTVAAYRPAIRSDFLPWLTDLKQGKTNQVKEYLHEGLGYADLGTAIILAFDLTHVISRSNIYDNIQDSEEIREHSLDPKECSRLIASCRGFTLGVTVTDKITGAIKIDFAEDISSLEPMAQGIALGILERVGLFVDDFDSWDASISPNQIQVKGTLSVQSLRKLLAMVDAAPQGATSFADQGAIDDHSNDPLTVNKNFFTAVNSLVDGVKPKLSAGSAYTRNAKWLRKYAEKIDGLPTLNVDPEMVDYGVYASETLREGAILLLDTNAESKTKIQGLIASGARSGGGTGWAGGGTGSSARYGGSYGARYGRGGGRSGRGTGQRLRDSTRANEKTEAIRSVTEMFIEFDRQKADLRRFMTQKFGSEF